MNFSDPYSHIIDLSEKSIIEKLGVDHNNIKEFRKKDLTDGVDYTYGKYNVVTYTRQGFEKLLTFCGLRLGEKDLEPLKAIITTFPVNRNILVARISDGREVRVRVKAIHNFQKGMEITIQRDSTGLFELKSPYPNISRFTTVICH